MALWILVNSTTNVVDSAQRAPAGQTPSQSGMTAYEIDDPDLWNELNGRIRSTTRDGRVSVRVVTLTPPSPPRALVRSDFAFGAVAAADPRRRISFEVADSATGPWSTPPAVINLNRGESKFVRLLAVNAAGNVQTAFNNPGIRFLFGHNAVPPKPYRLAFTSGISTALELDTSKAGDLIFDGSPDVTVYGRPLRLRISENTILS